MNIRHLATKGFDNGVELSKAVVYNGVPIVIRNQPDVVSFSRPEKSEVGVLQSIQHGKDDLKETQIGSVMFNDDSLLSLSQMFDYTVDSDMAEKSGKSVGTSFNDWFFSDSEQEYMRNLSKSMFPNINPMTGEQDIDISGFYSPFVPVVSMTGCIPAQIKDSEAYFNPNGVVSVAEFLDSLNSIKYGSNSNISRVKTLDNISDEDDYFNEGYNSCLSGLSSPFFNLYMRRELMEPITRIELAYITVVCWTQFIEKYNNLYGSPFYLGVNFDWLNPCDVLSMYADGFDYKASIISSDDENFVVSLNIKDYKSDRSMSEYVSDIKDGVSPIPLPMLMSLVELGAVGLFHFEDNKLSPLREVSRGELSYFIVKLASLFPVKYIRRV